MWQSFVAKANLNVLVGFAQEQWLIVVVILDGFKFS